MRDLTGRVAVVTGAGSGIGRSTALALAARGCSLALVDLDAAGLEATRHDAEALDAKASAHRVDVADGDDVDALAEAVVEQHGAVHLLLNIAGVVTVGPFETEARENLRWIVDINVLGVVNGCRSFLPALRRADEAHIVNVSSMAGLMGLPHNAMYSLTKGAVRSFSEALRAELAGTPIGVSVLLPGAVGTNILRTARGVDAPRLSSFGDRWYAERLTRPPEAAARQIVRAIEHNRPRVLLGPDARAIDVMARLAPGRNGAIGRIVSHLAG